MQMSNRFTVHVPAVVIDWLILGQLKAEARLRIFNNFKDLSPSKGVELRTFHFTYTVSGPQFEISAPSFDQKLQLLFQD